MAELATIARPYAEALFKASGADLAATQSWLDGLEAITGNEDLLRFAANPKVDADQVFQVVASALKTPLPEKGQNFLRVVIANDRLAAVPEMARQFRSLASGVTGTSEALIQSAFPLGEAAVRDLMVSLEKRFGRKLQPTVQVQPALIGGVRVVVGDEVLDTSVKARLEQMKTALTA